VLASKWRLLRSFFGYMIADTQRNSQFFYSALTGLLGRTSADIGASIKLELVDKFRYLGDMLSVDGDADAAVEARIGWNKFRQLVPLLTNKEGGITDYDREVVQQLCAKQ